MTTPIGAGTGPTPPPSVLPSTGGAGGVDTLGASSPYVIEGGLSIQQYARIINEAIDEFIQQLFETERQDQLTSRELYRHLGQSSATLLESINSISDHVELTKEIVEGLDQQIDTQNLEIDAINAGVVGEESAIAALNMAIDDFNNRLITAMELQVALDTYALYRTTRNGEVTSYNTTVDLYNLEILALNVTILELNAQRTELNETYSVEFPLMSTQATLPQRSLLPPGPVAPFVAPIATLATPAAEVAIAPLPEPPAVDLINADITTTNDLITTYNLGVISSNSLDITETSQVETLNQAITDFNNGVISSSQLQDAIDYYQIYKSGRDLEIESLNISMTTFLNAIPSYNLAIDAINVERESFGLLPIAYLPEEARFPSAEAIEAGVAVPDLITTRGPLPDAPNGPFVAPVDALDAPNLYPTIGLVGQEDFASQIGSVLIAPLFESALPFVTDLAELLQNNEAAIAFLSFLFPGRRSILPTALVDSFFEVRPERNEPARAAYTTLAKGLSSTNLEEVLSQAIFQAIPRDVDAADKNLLIQQTVLLEFQLLQRAGLAAVLPALTALAGDLPSLSLLPNLEINGAPLSVAYSLSFANEVRNIVTSGLVASNVAALVATNPHIGEGVVGSVAAAVNLNLLLIALVQVANTLQAPGLTAQLLSQLPLPGNIASLLESALAPPTFGEVVGSPLTEQVIVNIVLNSFLEAEGLLSPGRTGRVRLNNLISAIRRAVSAALQQRDPAGFLQTLEDGLAAIGFGPLDRAVAATNIRETLLRIGVAPEAVGEIEPLLNQLSGPLPPTNEGRMQLLVSVATAFEDLGIPGDILIPLVNSIAPLLEFSLQPPAQRHVLVTNLRADVRQAVIEELGRPGAAGDFARVPRFRDIALRAILFVIDQSSFVDFSQAELDTPLLTAAVQAEELRAALLAAGVVSEGQEASVAEAIIERLNQSHQIAGSLLTASQVQEELVRGLLRRDLLLRDLIVRDAISTAAVERSVTLRDLRNAAIQELIQQGDAIAAINGSERLINALRNDDILSERLQLALIDQAVLRDSIVDSFVQRGISESEAVRRASIVADQLRSDRQAFENGRRFRRAMENILVEEFGDSSAAAIAASIDLGIKAPDALPLVTPGLTQLLPTEALRRLIAERSEALLVGELNEEKVVDTRDRLLATLIDDDTSFKQLISDQIERLQVLQDEESIQTTRALLRDFSSLNVDLFTFVDRLRDPGYALIHSIWGGLMYTDDVPSNYKRELEFYV